MEKIINATEEIAIRKYCIELTGGKFFCYHNNRTRDAYREINNFKDLITERLYNVGYDFVISEKHKTAYATISEGMPKKHFQLTLLNSRVILCLIRNYIIGLHDVDSSSAVYYKWNDLLKDLSEFTKSSGEKNQVIDMIFKLKLLNLIDINVPKKVLSEVDEDDYVTITIYPALQCAFDFKTLSDVENKINSYITVKDVEKETSIDEQEDFANE